MLKFKGDINMFWGIVLMVVGAVILLNILLGLNLPVFRTLVGVLLIYWGVKVLIGSTQDSEKKYVSSDTVVFHSADFAYKRGERQEFNTVFGDSTVDLTQEEPTEEAIKIKVNSVFGHTVILVPKNSKITTSSNSVIGSVSLPENVIIDPNAPAYNFHLVLNSVFGDIQVKVKELDND
jgi:predicted membrane protein